MKELLIISVGLFLAGNLYSQNRLDKEKHCEDCKVISFNDNTRFPNTEIQDYKLDSCFVKVGIPIYPDSARIWVKGNEFYQEFSLNIDSQKVYRLEPPFYTKIINVSNSKEFVNVSFNYKKSVEQLITVKTKSKNDYSNPTGDYSILFYGCFQPFKVEGSLNNLKTTLISSEENLNYKMRQSFMNAALQKNYNFYELNRSVKKKGYYDVKTVSSPSPLISPVQLVIGTGDQIYSDAGYKFESDKLSLEEKKKVELNPALLYVNHPISAWTYLCCDPLPVVSPSYLNTHFNLSYNAFNSFSSLDTVFRTIPSINVWDDHEIRDGWGSHGDEYLKDGSLNLSLEPYFFKAKEAYIKHQFTVGGNDINENLDELNQVTKVGDFNVFTLDLRSKRNINESIVISDLQIMQFREWARSIEENEYAIIVSSIPFFYGNKEITEGIAVGQTNGELIDDLCDSWTFNYKQRGELLDVIISLRERGVKPVIVSGDVHVGVMSEVWYKPNGSNRESNEVLCYEIIASGLSHESLGEGQEGYMDFLRNFSEIQRNNDVSFVSNDSSKVIYPVTRVSQPKLNFGGIEYRNDSVYLNMFYMDKVNDSTQLEEYSMLLSYDKTFEEYESLCYKKPRQRIYNFFHPFRKVTNVELIDKKKQVIIK